MNIECLVLAAGYSSRCGVNKLLLPWGDHTVIETCLQAFYKTCRRIIVVTGAYTEDLKSVLAPYKKVETIYNPNYMDGMFSSVQAGASFIRGDRFFLTPGDYPLLSPELPGEMLEVQGFCVKPCFKGQTGHPILLNKQLAKRIVSWEKTSLSHCLQNIPSVKYATNQSGILFDIDTMEDYIQLRNWADCKDSLNISDL